MKKIKEKVASVGTYSWFSGLDMFKGRIIDPDIIGENKMKELKNKLDFQQYIHLSLCPLPAIHEEELSKFYSNSRLLEDETVRIVVKAVELSFNAEALW